MSFSVSNQTKAGNFCSHRCEDELLNDRILQVLQVQSKVNRETMDFVDNQNLKKGLQENAISCEHFVECIKRAIESPRLSKVDVAEIFKLPLEKVKALSKGQSITFNANYLKNPTTNHKKMMSCSDCFANQNEEQPPFYQKSSRSENNSYDPSKSYSAEQLMITPPPKITPLMRGIIQIVKQDPKVFQRDIARMLSQRYRIENVTQTSISRHISKIRSIQNQIEILQKSKVSKAISSGVKASKD